MIKQYNQIATVQNEEHKMKYFTTLKIQYRPLTFNQKY
jgi:hypothetical protein